MARLLRWAAGIVVVAVVTVAAIDYSYGQRREVWREVYRDAGYVWAYDAKSLRLFGPAEGCADMPYIEVWLSITNRQRGGFDRIRVHLAADTREYRFTDSVGYTPEGEVGEL